MGDTTEGSSGAAQSALNDESEENNRGFIGRFFDAFGGPGDTSDADPGKPHLIYPQPAMPGMKKCASYRESDDGVLVGEEARIVRLSRKAYCG